MLMETKSRMPPSTYFFIWVGVCRKRIIGKLKTPQENGGNFDYKTALSIRHSAFSPEMPIQSFWLRVSTTPTSQKKACRGEPRFQVSTAPHSSRERDG